MAQWFSLLSSLTETEDIKRWQEYTEELYKKDLNDPDNHDGVITHLEPAILECKVMWALESITMLASADTSGGYAVMLSYAAEHFDKMIPDLSDTVTLRGIDGKRRVKVWCIDENHTNPYKYAKAMGLGDHFSTEEITMLREVGEMKPIAEYDAVFDGNARIPVEFTANALVMIEISDIIK